MQFGNCGVCDSKFSENQEPFLKLECGCVWCGLCLRKNEKKEIILQALDQIKNLNENSQQKLLGENEIEKEVSKQEQTEELAKNKKQEETQVIEQLNAQLKEKHESGFKEDQSEQVFSGEQQNFSDKKNVPQLFCEDDQVKICLICFKNSHIQHKICFLEEHVDQQKLNQNQEDFMTQNSQIQEIEQNQPSQVLENQSIPQQEILMQIEQKESDQIATTEVKNDQSTYSTSLLDSQNLQSQQNLIQNNQEEEKSSSNQTLKQQNNANQNSFNQNEQLQKYRLPQFDIFADQYFKPENLNDQQLKCLGCFYGMAVGDSWGHLYEFIPVQYDLQMITSLSPVEFTKKEQIRNEFKLKPGQ